MQGQLDFFTESRSFPQDDLPLLSAELRLPRWDGTGGRRFDRYYAAYGRAFFSYCRRVLLPQAQAALELAQQNGGPVPEWHIRLATTVTLQREGVISLFTDTEEHSDGRRLVLRRSDTWDLRDASPLPLSRLFPPGSHWRRQLLEAAARQIRRQQELGVALYHPDWQRRLRSAFSADRFYITPEQLCLFYQMYAVAPAVEGIPVFSIPYNEEHGPFPPDKLIPAGP